MCVCNHTPLFAHTPLPPSLTQLDEELPGHWLREASPLVDEMLQVSSTAVLHDNVDVVLVPLEGGRGGRGGEGRGGGGEGEGRGGEGRGRRGGGEGRGGEGDKGRETKRGKKKRGGEERRRWEWMGWMGKDNTYRKPRIRV